MRRSPPMAARCRMRAAETGRARPSRCACLAPQSAACLRGEGFDEQPLPALGSEAIDFRAASESFAPFRARRRRDLEACHWDLGRFQGVCGEAGGGVMCDMLLVKEDACFFDSVIAKATRLEQRTEPCSEARQAETRSPGRRPHPEPLTPSRASASCGNSAAPAAPASLPPLWGGAAGGVRVGGEGFVRSGHQRPGCHRALSRPACPQRRGQML